MARRSSKWKRRLITATAAVGVVAGVITFRGVESIGPEKSKADLLSVIRVFDGDTVELTGGEKLRLLAIDTPEKGEPYYDTAKRLLAKLTKNKPVRVEYANQRRDRYGRLLGYLYVDDTLLVNCTMLDSGLAYLYLFDNHEKDRNEVKTMLAAQRRAIDGNLALWSVARDKEKYYVAPNSSLRLHRPDCRSVLGMRPDEYHTFATREEGLATGLSPCRNCKP